MQNVYVTKSLYDKIAMLQNTYLKENSSSVKYVVYDFFILAMTDKYRRQVEVY